MLFFPSYPTIYITVYYERDYYLLLIRLFDHALQFILIQVRTSYINTYILNISYTSDPQFFFSKNTNKRIYLRYFLELAYERGSFSYYHEIHVATVQQIG